MNRQELKSLLSEAGEIHGHLCPSLLYGCRLVALAKERIPPGARVETYILRHSSACFRDGVISAAGRWWQGAEMITIVEKGACSLEVRWEGGRIVLRVRRRTRRSVDALKADAADLATFRERGIALLMDLPDEEFSADGLPAPVERTDSCGA
jgi:formylmethanofuran dehydrogenase subunit E